MHNERIAMQTMDESTDPNAVMHLDRFVAIADDKAAPLGTDREVATILDRLHLAREMAGKLAADAMDEDQAVSAIETIHAHLQQAQHLAQRLGGDSTASGAQPMSDFIRHIGSIDLEHSMVGPWPVKA
jgi:hypothetical protein